MKTKNLSDRNDVRQLCAGFLTCKSQTEMYAFLRDLLTENELTEFAQRFSAAKMLSEDVSYEKIVAATGMSSTTVARVSKWLKNGMNGYQTVLNNMHHTPSYSLRGGLS